MLKLSSKSGGLGCWGKLGVMAVLPRSVCVLFVCFFFFSISFYHSFLWPTCKYLCHIVHLKSWLGEIAVGLSYHRLVQFAPATRAVRGTAALSKVSVDVLIACSSGSCRLTRAWQAWYQSWLCHARGSWGWPYASRRLAIDDHRDVSRW